jgi:hypothetical protein
MASSVAALDHAAFGAIIQRVFRERTSTMVDEARPDSVAEFHDSLTSSRRAMRALLETLPETAFEPQPAIGDEPCWSAGQIVVHTVEYQVNTFLRAARLAVGLVPGPEVARYQDHATVPTLSRAEALALLDLGDRDVAAVLDELPAGADVAATRQDEFFDAAGYKDMLLFNALHDDDHLAQLRELAGD